MTELGRADAARLLDFLADAHAVEDPDPFSMDLLARLVAVTESDAATYIEYADVSRLSARSHLTYSTRFVPDPPRERPEWARADHRSDFARTHEGDVVMWSDHLDRSARMRFESVPWAEFYGLVDQVHIRMWPAVLLLTSYERDFTARDRLIANALRPHAASLVRHARGRRDLAALQAAVDSAEEGDPRGFVIVGGGDSIEYASPPARRLLAAWFGNGLGGRLPAPIGDWLTSTSRNQPLRVETGGRRLVVESPTSGALVLTEGVAPPQSLTARELEVLRGVAAGKSTAEIAADLWVTPATVSKHLEHIYRKLGVASRTAALAAMGVRVDV
jgi:DNA-binding CsgD family transcriptional regulator